MSETRQRLAAGEPRVAAARAATARIAPLVLAAGLLIAGGALSLLAGEMQFFRVFGPGLAVTALVVTLVCVTLVPALMALARAVALRPAATRPPTARSRRWTPCRRRDASRA